MIVDPIAPGIDLKPFWELMANEAVVKVESCMGTSLVSLVAILATWPFQ